MSPAIGQPSAEADDRPQWRRDIAARIGGEDPGRWLDRPLTEAAPGHTDWTMRRAVNARIQGIRSREVVRAWLEVETSLDRDACPRQAVIRWLNQRDAALKDRGGRDE